jgi:hypothetical protein
MDEDERPRRRRTRGRRLTAKQVAVLAAVERLGNPTVPELAWELDAMVPSEIVRVLDALEARERVVATGARHWIYLGDPAGIPYAPQIPAEEVVRYRSP